LAEVSIGDVDISNLILGPDLIEIKLQSVIIKNMDKFSIVQSLAEAGGNSGKA
jgi:hypothetical protein